MVHLVTHIACFSAALLLLGIIAGLGFDAYEAARERRRQQRRRASLDYQSYAADEAIRALKRQAVHEMLEAERAHRHAYHSPDIIESTAVEVDRR
jgi:hypothetical protein